MAKRLDNRSKEVFVKDLARILSCEGLHLHTRRAVLYKAIEDYSKILKLAQKAHWSEAAMNQYKVDNFSGLVLEHPIPKSIITGHITPKEGSQVTDQSILEQDLDYAFSNLVLICWVTKHEDDALRKLGLKNNFPATMKWGWDEIGMKPWARYDYADITVTPQEYGARE